jgi:hypothetical protein
MLFAAYASLTDGRVQTPSFRKPMQNFRAFKALCLCATILAFATSHANAGGTVTGIPVTAVDSPREFWGATMAEFYGPYDRNAKCWRGKSRDSEAAELCMRPHKMQTVEQGGRTIHFLVFGGYEPGPDGGHETCHACSGRIGMVMLEAGDNGHMRLVARDSLGVAAGGWGDPPPEEAFELRRAGPADAATPNHVWVMETGYTGQGYTFLNKVVYGAVGDRIEELANIPSGFDDQGNCDNGRNMLTEAPCSDFSAELRFRDEPGKPYSDAFLTYSGTDKGEQLNANFELPFDGQTMRYSLPANLPGTD